MAGKTYFFHPEKKILKQGYLLEDDQQQVVYEAKVLKQSLIGASEIEFINHLSGRSETHKVGKTVTTETSGMLGMFSTKSHFKFDGKKIWDYLHEKGIRIDSALSGGKIGMTYRISLRGEEIATIASAAANNSNFIVTSGSCYQVTTSEEHLDIAFLITMAFARTDQAFYD